ncbi:DUF4234 domain-containing protein [Nocardioides guangzhouensis]|uniref:DUF4234 domain-containing protein n=1 Tax=Nocardioides guangzhouensis TaxID=2497878 RepID=A0A4V1XZI0_9ACTN|nr:DUF4234 domain-containing protein [Nocardioides guangzhouensis]RYP86819.1 DUF4234 domain-containing protein [Nocardioides guangzhouensis]
MTENNQANPPAQTPDQPASQNPQQPPHYGAAPAYDPAPYQQLQHGAPLGKIRGTGTCILLMFVTFGIYGLVWYYSTHDEMKRHSGQGIGGGIALLLALFVGIVMPYLTSSEVGGLYERAGRERRVSGATGLWYFPGMLIIVGPIVWFVKTNGALNDYWRSLGAS